MVWSIDARVPVRFGSLEEAGAEDAVLLAEELGTPGHAAGCACCVGRAGAGVALGRLFERRARGEVAFFRRVLVVGGEAEVREALRSDALAAGRYRLEG